MSNLQIFKATPKDWKLYKEIRLETLLKEHQAFSSTYKDAILFPENYWKNKLEDQQSIYLLAQIENRVVGAVRTTRNDREEQANTAVIGGLYVKKEYRGLGVGKKLLITAIDTLATYKNISKIKLSVVETQKEAISLYRTLGFKELDIESKKHTKEIILEKTL